jgi:DGQHR domain-containing protein
VDAKGDKVVKVSALRTEHTVGTKKYPIFIGFLRADQLDRIAEAPQFQLTTPHHVIAGNVISSPVADWQRPLDLGRVDEIARIFKNSEEIMPNAVLLAMHNNSGVKIQFETGDLWSIDISTDQGKPIWILDGQHRIAGLTKAGSHDKVPFVLLASHAASAQYQESTFAKIFAQVTTTAEGLHDLHDEWLTYAFRLGKYDVASPVKGAANQHQADAMTATISLCHNRFLDQSKTIANPFFDRVAFNPGGVKRQHKVTKLGPVRGGFEFDASEFQDLIRTSYYAHKSLPAGVLSPEIVARELGLAYDALVDCHGSAERSSSVLLNSGGGQGHRPLQEGFIHGVLRFLAAHGVPKDWGSELRSRAFDTSDWDAATWSSAARGGSEGNLNKKLAFSIFGSLLEGNLSSLFLPTASVPNDLDLWDYFKGDVGFGLEVRGRRLSPKGTRVRFSPKLDPFKVLDDSKKSTRLDLGTLRAVSASNSTPNVLSVAIADVSRPHDKNWRWSVLRSKRGVDLTPDILHSATIELEFLLTFYGGESVERTLKIQTS